MAETYLDRGLVALPDVRQDGRLITSLIESPGQRPYRVYIRLESAAGSSPLIRGECSCPERGNCEHVVAVLLRTLEEAGGLPDQGSARLQQPSASVEISRVDYPDEVKQRLLYLLLPEQDCASRLTLRTVSARLLNSGGFSGKRDYRPEWVSRGRPPRFLLDVDIQLLSELARLTEVETENPLLTGQQGGELLRRMLQTGRCFLQRAESPLSLGPLRSGIFEWRLDAQGVQFPRFLPSPPAEKVLFLDTLWYLDVASAECGQLDSGFSAPSLKLLFELIEGVKPEQVQQQQARFLMLDLPPLRSLQVDELPLVKPHACLRFITETNPAYPDQGPQDLIRLSFDYDGHSFAGDQPSQWLEGDRVVRVKRNRVAERAVIERLMALGFVRQVLWVVDDGADSFSLANGADAWFRFQLEQLPRMQREGWKIEFEESFRYRLMQVQDWQARLEPMAEQDWFRLGLNVQVEGEPINLLPALLVFLREFPLNTRRDLLQKLNPEQKIIVPLDAKRMIPVPLGWLRSILEILFELYHSDALDADGKLPLNRFQVARLTELKQLDGAFTLSGEGVEEIERMAERLRGVLEISELAAPQGLQARLRDYQRQGLAWLQFLRESGFAGVLADDMGLGKTVQTLAHLLLEKEQGRMDRPSLVVAPTSLMVNWRREARRFAPDLRVLLLHGPQRHAQFQEIGKHDLVLTSYPLLARDSGRLMRQPFHLLILDEAQMIKNPKAQAGQVVRQLNARHRLCLTGTPLENHLGELWSLFDFLLPGLLGSEKQFRRAMRNPIEKQADEAVAERLARRVQPFMLRRTKQEVVQELPPKTEILRSVELAGAQRELYESIRLSMHERVRKEVELRGWGQSHILVLDALLKLRQVCCDPRLLKLEAARKVKRSAKLELLMEMLPEMIEEGRRILLFSQFTSMLGLIEEAVRKAGIDYVKLTGSTRDRAAPVDRFQNAEVPLFLISLKAGGTGLNLTAADTVIHYDPWWNPAVERQATDRAHRIGQENPVFVYKLISEGTVEEKIQAMQAQKQALADNLFEQARTPGRGWTEADLEMLFEPLE